MSTDPHAVAPDTSVILPILMSSNYEDDLLFKAWEDRAIIPLATPSTLVELHEAVLRVFKSKDMDEAAANRRVSRFAAACDIIPDEALRHWPHFCRDPDDQVFLDLAYTGNARYIVSNDDDLIDMANTPAPVIRRGEATRRAAEQMRSAG